MQRKLIKFLSVLLLICTICVVFGLTRPAEAEAATAKTLVLKVNGEWTSDGARFAAYFFKSETDYKWVSMTSKGNNIYICSVPSGYTGVIFVRMNGGNSTNSWDNKWNQSSDLSVPADTSCMYTMKSGWWDGDNGTWGACSHSWNSGTQTKAPTCTATGTKTYTCNYCGGTKTESVAALGHSYSNKVTNPTCTAQGYTTHTCTRCSNSYKDTYTSALGHSWSSSTGKCTRCSTACSHSYSSSVTKAATCTSAGTKKYTCSTCKYSYTESITKLGHSYKNTVTAATCTAQGYTTHTCTRSGCGYSYNDTYTSALGHNYAAATCTKPQTCTRCSATTGSSLGHKWTYKVTKNPTTSASGTLVGTCSTCGGSTGNITIGKLGTTYHSYKVTKAATCTATGTGRYTWGITDYGTYYWDVSIPATGHSYKSVVTAPTCTAQGYTTYTCSSCSNSYKDNYTTAKGHSWSASTGKCSTCGTACSHSWNSGSVTTQPTCTAAGVKTYTCNTCKTTKTESVDAKGHSYSGGKCASCGDVRPVQLSASFNDWNISNMTYSANGYTYSTTLAAGTYYFKVIKDDVWLGNNGEIWDTTAATSSVGWEFADWANDCTLVATGGTYNFTFNYDSNMLIITFNHTHAYTAGAVTAPTCTAKGYTTYTCACGATEKRDEKAALGHSHTSAVTKAATCTADGVRTYTCSRCSDSYTEAIAKLGHDYKSAVTAPTCTAQGYTTHTCSRCSDSYKDAYKDATGHNYTSAVTKAATCTADGVRTYTCSKCSHSYTEAIAKLGHDYSPKVTAPTCTAQGYTTHTCSRCSDSYKDTYKDALGHKWTYKVTKNPTTSASGTLVGTCSTCGGSTGNIAIGRLGTDYHSYKVITAATCTATGTGRYTWGITDYGTYTWDVEIPAKGHAYSSKVTAPTCTAQGYTTHTCSDCGHSYTDSYKDATGHAYTSKVTTAATCTSDGVKTFTCGNCNHSYTESIAKLGHDYKATVTAATCTAQGFTTYTCSRCSDSYVADYVDAKGHSYAGGKCGNCGDTKVVSVNGTFNDWAGQNMTWTEKGYTFNIVLSAGTYDFKILKDGVWLGNNGDIENTTVKTSDIGWEFADWADDCTLIATGGTYTFTFNFDTNMLVIEFVHSHAYAAGEVVAPTCEAEGYTVYTCPCGDSYHSDEKVALGHDHVGEVTTAATCTSDGVKTFTCSRCGDSYTQVIGKLGHDYKAVVTAPTCEAKGYTTHTCSRCADSYVDSYVAATGHKWNSATGACDNCGSACDHKWGNGVVTKPAGCTYAGSKLFTCTICGDTKTENLPATGHSYTLSAVGATCTEKGYTLYTCSTCGDSYKASYVDATGHSYTSKVTLAATCTADGVKTFTCGNCSHSYTEVIPATGHSYAGGKCGNCGDTKVVSVNGTFNDWAGQNMTWTEKGYTFNIVLSAGTYDFKILKDGVWLGNNGDIEDTTVKTSDIGWEFADWADDCTLIATGGTYTFTFNFDTNMLVIEFVHSHAYVAGEVVAPTCEAEGYTVYTCPCGDSYHSDEKVALGHDHVGEVTTDATCTSDGVKTFTCSRCGDSYTQVIGKLGHDYKAVVTAPTCEAKGYTTHTCSRCADSYKDSYVDALGHNFVDGSCQNCGTGCDHQYTSKVTKDPTCTADGVRTYTCSVCGGSYTEAIDKLGHSYSGKVTVPTCTAEGYTTYTCSTCGDVYTADKVAALGHSYSEEVTDATCEKDGLKTFTCGNCSHSYTEVISATGHSYAGGKCGNCGDTKVVSVNGTFNDWAGQNMTWTEKGYTFNIVLSAGTYDFKILKDGVWLGNNGDIEDTTVKTSDIGWEFADWGDDCTLIATGGTYTFTFNFDTNMLVIEFVHSHAYAAGEVVAPTCEAEGYTVYTCPCGDSYKDDYTEATGHSYVGNTCQSCGDVREYYLFGYINGTDYAYGDNGNFLGELKFVDGKLTLVMTTDSYVAVKADDNWTWYMAESYCTDKTVVLKNTALGEHIREKMFVPAGTTVTFTLVINTDDTLMLSYVIDACEHKYESVVTAPSCTVGGYTTHTCSVCDDTYTDSYTETTGHSYVGDTCQSCGAKRDYYLIGWINGQDYGFNDDAANLGEYKFVNGKLVATFEGDCYVFVKTGDNLSWYQAEGYSDGKSVILYNDALGLADPNKLYVPGGVEVTFTLVVNNDETLVLSYEITNCAHSYTEKVTTEPTCENPGVKTYTCSVCGNSYTEQIDALGHDYQAAVTAPTCTAGGYTIHTCSRCGDSYTDSQTAALGHSYSEEVTDATCEKDGLKTYNCSNCGDSYTEVIPATGHSYTEEVTTAPTCEDKGEKTFTCSACGHSYTESIDALGHSYIHGVCGICGQVDPDMEYITVYFQNNWLWTDVHAYVWTGNNDYITPWPGVEATFYANNGTYDIYCVTIPAGYKVIFNGTKNDGTDDADQTPDIADAANGDCYTMIWNDGNAVEKDKIENIYCEHSYTSEQTKAPTCTEPGEITYTCSKCGDSYTEEIDALGHDHKATVTAPTCTDGGYTTYTCACGDSYTADKTEALGHSYVDGVCDRCGEREPVSEYITIYFQNNWLWTDVYAYVWTGENAYITAWPGEKAVFFANDGTYDIYSVTIPAGYKVIFNGTKNDGTGATDQSPDILGAADGDCYWMTWNDGNAVEKDHIDNVYTPVCEHNYTVSTTAPTCESAGKNVYTCSKCGDSYSEEIPALGHNYVDGTCTGCGQAKPVTDYYLVGYINGADYGCNEDGDNLGIYKFVNGQLIVKFDADSYIFLKTSDNQNWYMFEGYCEQTTGTLYNTASGLTDANKMFVPGGVEVIFTLVDNGDDTFTLSYVENICEHNYQGEITTDATCTAPGVKTYTCDLCGDSYTEEIPVKGHSYVNGVCSVCGYAKDNNIKIHFVNTLGWQGVVGYIWKDTNGTTSSFNGITWPGIIVQRDNDGYYTVELEYAPVSGQSLGLLFHDFYGNKTADVLISYEMLTSSHEIWVKPATSKTDGKYSCTVVAAENGTVISPEVNGQEVTFRYAGTATSVALAGTMNGWSTSANLLTKGDDGVWSITLTLDPGVYEYKFVVNGSAWNLDPANGNVGGFDGNSVLVVPADDTIPNNGQIKVVLHYYRADGNYSGWDVWFWGQEKEGAVSFTADPSNKGMTATFTVDGSKNANLGYVIRKSDWSNQEFYDRFIDLSDVKSGTVHYYVNSGVASGSRVLGEDVVSVGKLSYANYNYEASTVWVKATLPLANPIAGNFSICDGNGNATGITVTSATLENNGYRLTLSKGLTITQANTYKVKYENSYANIYLDTTDLFYSDKFASEYTYNGNDLGATWSRNSTTFKVWAPTALNVHVKIYDSGNYGSGNQVQYVQMTPGDKGVWTVTVPGNWHGYYYNYDVTFAGYTVEATDPYARSTGSNGDRGMILNLDATDPAGWANDISPNQGMSYTDAIIYELHVREFTNDSNSGVKAEWRGNYLGLTQTGTTYQGHATGLDYLKAMGVTHVQLMPVTDFSSVDEYHDGYAWGYDPKNFMTPEGSYSTDPFNGSVRVNEFKEMVQTFHENGINVTMDVVFNHAFDGGNFCYNQIVPNYFSRFYGDGSWSNGSGVGNDLATERAMTRNYIVDTILYWVEEYHVDGFRFDLAGLIDTQTIQEIVSAVHAKHPYVMFYGEGWAAGGTAVEYGYTLATKDQAWQLGGFGFFNDDYRNGIAGDNGNSWGFASGSWDYENSLANWFEANNTFSKTPTQTINYVSCHDNYCLTDKLLISKNGTGWEDITKMNRLSNAIVMMSEGVPFLYSGDEMLRERKDYSGNRLENAHMGGDYANTINWADLVYKQYADATSDYYKGLIEFRKNHAALRISDSSAQNYVTYHRISDQTVMFYISGYPNYECSEGIVVIFNASSNYTNVDLYNYGIPTGNWQAVIHGDKAGVTPLWGVDVTSTSGSVGVEGISTTVLVLGDLVHEESVYNKQPSKCSHYSHNISAMCTDCGKTVSHNFVNGVCACGLSQSAPATYTVYYDNSVTNWNGVNVYAWTTTAGQTKEYAGTWSGSAMTLIDKERNIYAYELPIGAMNVIFNGDGSQSDNLTAPGYASNDTMYSNGSWVIYEGACEHSYSDEYIEEPTCSLGGVVKHTCSLCGYEFIEEVETLGHDYVAEVTEATCTTAGYTTYTCSRCDHSYVEDEIAALGHDYVDGICSVCGTEKAYFLFGYINGANYGCDGDEATMGIYKFVDGQLTVTFQENSYVGIKTIDNENWYMTDGYLGEAVTSATLYDTSVGINADKLFVPGGMKITFTMVINEDGTLTLSYEAAACEHEYEATVTAPTCTEAGYTTHKCIFCGDSYTDTEVEALGHDFADGFCQRCGAIDPAVCEHEYDEGVVTDPTCTDKGYTTYTCDLCGHSYTADENEALGHSYEAVVTDPTCTEPGFTTHTCSVCDDSYTDSETEATGHNFVDGFCDICGAVDPATCEHEYESVVTEPTCTAGGYTTNTCSICGHVEITDETEMLDHSYESVVTEPTCTAKGYTTYTCIVCGDSYVSDETEMLDHSYVDGACENCGAIDPVVCEHEYESVVTEPTCTAKGYTTNTCTICGHVEITDETEMLDHSFVDGVCEHCGALEETPECEHEYVKSAATATCTEPGGDKYTCSKCGDVYYENATEALGHNYVDGICDRCGHLKPLSTTYYLVGWINGGNHGCEEDGANMGNYPITDNMFKYTFRETSYVFLKTEGNGKWFMCDGYPGDGVCFANLYDTGLPIKHDKVNVPGGVEITFTLIERDDGSVTLTYVTAGNCSHNWYTQTQVWPGCTTTGVMLHRCIMCADSYTTTIPAKGHSYNGGSHCWDCGAQNPNYTYYYQIVGWINGQNVGCEENWEQPGFQFSGNRLTMTFTENSYIYLKTHDNSKWFMTDGYPGDDATSATFYHTDSYWEIQKDKLFVPKGRTITFTISVRSDNTIYLSYVAASCQHTYDSWMNFEATCTSDGERAYKCTKCDDYYTEVIKATGHNFSGTSCTKCGAVAPGQAQIYYLVGWINGANYGCEEDYLNMGIYKFVDGQLIVTFNEDSYIYIKTQGNTKWFLTQSYVETNSGTFYEGGSEKMKVPGGVEYRFTLVENADGSLTLTYGPSSCTHTNVTEQVTAPTCTEKGFTTLICNDCGHRETANETEATGHSYVDGACEHCGAIDPAVCQHVYGEGVVTEPTCTAKGYTTYICTICGTTHVGNETDKLPHDFVDGICTVCGAEKKDPSELFYLVGYINGADYGCNEDYKHLGIYQFVDGKLMVKFAADSYVYIKTGDNLNWFMTAEYVSGTTGTFANTSTGAAEKMLIPGGTEVILTLVANEDGTLTLSYVLAECEGHSYTDTVVAPTCIANGYTVHTCQACGFSYRDAETEALGHNHVDGTCDRCGEQQGQIPDTNITVYFQNNWNWSDVFVYYWNDEGSNAEWPGVPATWYANDGTYDIYCVTMPAGSKVIFSGTKDDGTGSDQTPDILDAEDGNVYWMTWNDGNGVEKDHIDNILGDCQHEYEATVTEPGCKTPGYTTHNCKFCADSYVDTHTAPVGHNYVDGICDRCGEARIEELQDFYLIGYINGANYGCDEDWENLGIYKFVDGKLVVHFKADSYVFVKTGDNGNWFMTEGFGGTDIPYAELFNTNVGLTDANKLFVPGGMKITFVLVRTGDDTFILGYTASPCEHPSHTITGKCEFCGEIQEHSFEITVNDYTCTEDGGVTHTCTVCGHSYTTDTVPATGHAFVDGSCKYCGIADESGCAHEYELTVDEGKCNLGAFTVNTCKLCGNVYHVYFNADMDWTMDKPVDIHDNLLATKPMFSYRDYETVVSDVDTMEGWELIGSQLIDEELGIYQYTFGRWTEWSDWSEEEVLATETREVRTATAFRNVDAVICDHVYEAFVTAPTCAEMGYTTYICAVCGETYVTEYTDVLGHGYEAVVTAPTCAAGGYTTYTCSKCGDSYVSDQTAALAHEAVTYSFVNNVHTFTCTTCGQVAFTKTATDGKKFNINTAAPVLSDDIVMKYGVTIPAGFENPYMVFDFNGESFLVEEYDIDASNGRYVFKFPGINPQKMGDNICSTLYATVDGYEVSLQFANYSLLAYCDNQLKKSNLSATLRTQLSDVLVYGEKTQLVTGYKTDALVTTLLSPTSTLTPSTFPASLDESLNLQKVLGDADARVYYSAVNLSLGSKMAVRLTVVCNDTSLFTYKVNISGREYTYTGEDLVPVDGSSNKYYLYFNQMKATELDQKITFTIWEGDTQISDTIEYSVYTYVLKNYNNSKLDENTRNLLKAIYNYGETTKLK